MLCQSNVRISQLFDVQPASFQSLPMMLKDFQLVCTMDQCLKADVDLAYVCSSPPRNIFGLGLISEILIYFFLLDGITRTRDHQSRKKQNKCSAKVLTRGQLTSSAKLFLYSFCTPLLMKKTIQSKKTC